MNILIVGCSFSDHSGFTEPAGKVWYHHIPKQHSVTNLSVGGQGNYKIFINTCTELLINGKYDLVIIQWSTLHRLSLNSGLSVYDKSINFTLSSPGDQQFEKFHSFWVDNFIHTRIDLSEFLSLVSALAIFLTNRNIPYIFIKGSDNFLTDLQHKNWKQCSNLFLDSVLSIHQLPDSEIDKFYTQLRSQFISVEKVSASNWLNLYGADWFSNCIDHADDNMHAGIETNKIFFDQVHNFIKSFEIYL